MIPHSRKFPLRTDFLSFRRSAKRLSSSLFTLYYLPVTSPSRCAVIVSKKNSKLAVTRNWLKRRVYDAAWPLIKDKSLDLVIHYKPNKLARSPELKQQIISELESLASQL